MWLEFAMGLCGGLFLGGGAFVAVEMHRPILLSEDLVDRIKKIARAEVGWRFKRKPRHISIDVALHAQIDVDMKWWDEEFEKLQRAIPTNVWTKFDDACASNPIPPTSAEFSGWMTNAEMAYSVSALCDTVDLASHARNLGNLLSARMITVDEARASMSGAKAALESLKSESERCENCEYVEEMTFASKYVNHRVTRQCERCLAEDLAHRIREISGYWG